jgi:hypothetical protein
LDSQITQVTQRSLVAATKTTVSLDPQMTQIGRFDWEPTNRFRKTRFRKFVVEIPTKREGTSVPAHCALAADP